MISENKNREIFTSFKLGYLDYPKYNPTTPNYYLYLKSFSRSSSFNTESTTLPSGV